MSVNIHGSKKWSHLWKQCYVDVSRNGSNKERERDRFSSYFQTLRIVSRIYDAQQSIFGKVLGVWKFGDILSLVRYVLSKKTKAMEKTKTFAKKLTVTGFKIRYPDQSR